MTVRWARLELADELEAAYEGVKDAEAAYIARLSALVDIKTLQGGRDGYDFYADVPGPDMHEITQRIVALEYAIEEEYGIHFRTYAIATPP
jgi:hypothetical protein